VDSRHVLSGSGDTTLRLWDTHTGETVRVFQGHTHWVACVALLDERHALSSSADDTLRLWDLKTGDCLRVFAEHSDDARYVLPLTGGFFISAAFDKTLRLWHVDSSQAVQTLNWPYVPLCLAQLNPHQLLVGDETGAIHWLDLLP
jgi:WD40 repeat protein